MRSRRAPARARIANFPDEHRLFYLQGPPADLQQAAPVGALLTMGVMVGAIASHLLVLGIEVKGDGGLLFGLALTAFVASALVLAIRRSALPLVGRYFELA